MIFANFFRQRFETFESLKSETAWSTRFGKSESDVSNFHLVQGSQKSIGNACQKGFFSNIEALPVCRGGVRLVRTNLLFSDMQPVKDVVLFLRLA